MKKIWLSGVLVLLAGVVFADMDSERFYTALNLKLGFAAYGIIDVDTDSSSYNKREDENGDGVILDMYTPDTWTNVFNIANANNGRYMMVVLSNDSAFGNSSSNEVKVYKLDYSNIKEQFIKDFENTRANILGGASGNKQNNSQSGSASGSQNNTNRPPPPDASTALDFLPQGNSSSSSAQADHRSLYYDGTLYDPRNGRSYPIEIWFEIRSNRVENAGYLYKNVQVQGTAKKTIPLTGSYSNGTLVFYETINPGERNSMTFSGFNMNASTVRGLWEYGNKNNPLNITLDKR